jgi:hypothetical protein
MSRRVPLAAALATICWIGLAARPAFACWYCTQRLVCDPNGGSCQPFAMCTQASGFCTNCAITCTDSPGLCNHNAGDQCQWALNALVRHPIASPAGTLVERQRSAAS